ncbi:Bug family tripartite tricarboxylate transporter substrate binding protein [Roseomonas sp. CCTCC AB2023176]|uniref:Bug family tripartite tricarboxylate transporter substrate binding protein n=1 Tax=Roseomonas sp. CCTCC AB2023176 TaxID=3342640 RepID=UPI0035E36F37
MSMQRRTVLGAALALPALACPAVTRAQGNFPDRPLRVIVPFGAGGPTDVVGRLLTDPVQAAIGQPMVIENRAGAGGNIGTREVARAAPDGHTLVLNAASPLVINQWLYRDMGYDPLTAFAPVSMLTTGPLLVIANPRAPFSTMGELVEYAKRNPGVVNYATAGNGTVPHLATEMFLRAAGIELTNVTYRATPQATQSVLSGETALFFDSPASITHVRSGAVKALAVTTPRRFAPFPEVPTVKESGGPEIAVEAWYGLLAPAGTPADRVARLHDAFATAIKRPEVAQRLAALGFEPVGNRPEEFAVTIRAEAARWGDVIRAANVRIE